MSLPHEEAAHKIHPEARRFEPVTSIALFKPTLIGWIFTVSVDVEVSSPLSAFRVGENGNSVITDTRFGWVTRNGDVPSDLVPSRADATRNLRIYVKHIPNGSPQKGDT